MKQGPWRIRTPPERAPSIHDSQSESQRPVDPWNRVTAIFRDVGHATSLILTGLTPATAPNVMSRPPTAGTAKLFRLAGALLNHTAL